jgi:phage regulator Rha-like protein
MIMNEPLTFNNELTMSSREITSLTGKKHYNVKRDIENLAAQLEVDVAKFEHIYTDSQDCEQTEYLLDLETCLCLIAGYNAKQRMKIIKHCLQS